MTYFSTKSLIFGGAIGLAALTAAPASAQPACPAGYYYQYGYGCIPAGEAYGDMYGDDYGYDAPVYDGFGLAFGFGGGRGHGGGGFHGGGGRAGGGGFHGGGHSGGGHSGGGGHRR